MARAFNSGEKMAVSDRAYTVLVIAMRKMSVGNRINIFSSRDIKYIFSFFHLVHYVHTYLKKLADLSSTQNYRLWKLYTYTSE